MRMILTFAAPLLALATASSTMSAGGAMPDPTREYNQNVDCHNAYDRLVAEKKAGTSPSASNLIAASAASTASLTASLLAGIACHSSPPRIRVRRTRKQGRRGRFRVERAARCPI